jgi:uncharacterized membrane protein
MLSEHGELVIVGVVAEAALVTGQLLLKRAMHKGQAASAKGKRVGLFVLAIAAQTLYFFLWLGLLSGNDLSRVYPLDAGGYALLVLTAVVLLHERLTLRAWAAIGLIVAGVAIISFS